MSQIVKFRGEECTLIFRPYYDGNTCIQLICSDGSSMCTATINMPEINVDPSYVIIKDYSENVGVLEVLENAKILQRIEQYEINNFGTTVWLCELLHGFKPYWTAFKNTGVPLEGIAGNKDEPKVLDTETYFSLN